MDPDTPSLPYSRKMKRERPEEGPPGTEMEDDRCLPCSEPVSPSFDDSRNTKRERPEEGPPGTIENPLREVPVDQRVEGLFYTTRGKNVQKWNGKIYVCKHGRNRSLCKECGGKGICKHGRVRTQCRECDGATICKHRRQRSKCKECDGASICQHGKHRNKCKECGGKDICEHGRRRSQCKECVTAEQMQERKNWCSICCNKHIDHRRLRAGKTMCAECDATVPDRIEVQLRPKLVELVGFEPSALDDALFGTDAAMCDVVKRRRPDFLWQSKRVVICVECDEKGGHGSLNYTPECDGGWMADMTVALTALHQKQFGKAPFVFFLRFNPDERDGKRARVDLDQRLRVVADRVNEIRALQKFKGLRRGVPMVEYYYYHSKCLHMIDYTRDRPDAFRVLNVVD